MTFVDLGLKMMPEKESFLPQEWCQMGPFPDKAATSGHNEFQERSMVLKVLPNSISGSKKKFKNGEVW